MDLVGLDVGSTACKALVVSPGGSILGYGFDEYGVLTDRTGKAEQDAEYIWSKVKRTLREACKKAGNHRIGALSLSVQGDAIIPVDRNFRALHNAVLGMDYRSASTAAAFGRLIGDRLAYQRTGMRPHPINAAVKALWLKENAPDVYEKAFKIVTYADYILGKLGAEPSIDMTMASRTGVFDIREKRWAFDLIAKAGLDAGKFSKILPSAAPVGTISAAVAAELDLPKDLLLITGGHDQTCAALGAGLVDEGTALLSSGTAEVLSACFHTLQLNEGLYEGFYPCYLHAKAPLLFTFALNHTGGLLLRWYRDTLASAETEEAEAKGINAYDLIMANASPMPSPVMVLPHFNGSGTPWCDMDSKGAILGLTVATGRNEIAMAVLEALTFEMKINAEKFRQAGIRVDEYRIAGGGAKSPKWIQLRADVFDKPFRTLKVREAACVGAAILAGKGSGAYASVDEGVAAQVDFDKEYSPRKELAEKYKERFDIYRTLYSSLSGLNRKL